jgi:hypothetical protein
MKSQIPTALGALRSLAQSAISGCEELEGQLNLMHTTSSIVSASFKKLEDSQQDLDKAGTALTKANADSQALDVAAYNFIQTASRIFKKSLGNQFNSKWEPTGYPNKSTRVPSTADDRMVLVRRIELFLKDNATMENDKQDVTAVFSGKLYQDIVAARDAATKADTDQDTKKGLRDKAKDDLRSTLQNLTNELELLIENNDPRWKRFGFEIPAQRHTPDAPENVTVNNDIPGKLLVKCDPVPAVEHYRFWIQEIGTTQEPAVVGSSQEPQFLIENLAAGKRFNVFVSAVNSTGRDSSLSEPAVGAPKAVAA